MSAAHAFIRLCAFLVKNSTVGKGMEGIFQVTETVVMSGKESSSLNCFPFRHNYI